MRFYHDGSNDKCHAAFKHSEHGWIVRRPDLYCPKNPQSGDAIPQYEECGPNAIAFGIPGKFCVVEPGGYVDVPNEISVAIIKSIAPRLLTEEEALVAGIAQRPETVPAKPKVAKG